MSLAINNNLAASSAARNLGAHYTNLTKSVRRLSSGLRVSTAADDAAGLAIRELMRADITALNQGARNVNDAISMLQTADGALGIIDEKLIRMKELAEQAATGTYNSDQRLMIDSEFQAMAAEIDRIANATDFNGQKILDGKFAVPGAEIVGPDNKTYDSKITGSETIAQVINGISAETWTDQRIKQMITEPGNIVGDTTITITNNNIAKIGDNYLAVSRGYNSFTPGQTINITYDPAAGGNRSGGWSINGVEARFGDESGFTWMNGTDEFSADIVNSDGVLTPLTAPVTATWTFQKDPSFTVTGGDLVSQTIDEDNNTLTFKIDVNGNTITQTYSGVTTSITNSSVAGFINAKINISVRDTTPKADDPGADDIPDNVVKIHFGAGNDRAEDYYYIEKQDATIKGLGLEGVSIRTQATAQDAIEQVDGAIIKKDTIRAYFGATQNRLENTLSNIRIQAENLGTAESQLSDVDISQEMTNFVRNQILVQSGVAMLAQANALPRMALQLLNG